MATAIRVVSAARSDGPGLSADPRMPSDPPPDDDRGPSRPVDRLQRFLTRPLGRTRAPGPPSPPGRLPISLRARLLAISLLLVACGLAATGWATHHYLSSFLVDRLDQQLRDARGPARTLLEFGCHAPRGPSGLVNGTVVQLRDAGGSPLPGGCVVGDEQVTLPAGIPPGYSDVQLSVGDYRFLSGPAVRGPIDSPADLAQRTDTMVIGMPLRDVRDTLGRVLVIELLVGAAILALLGGIGAWLVRLGLRPLSRMEQTAGAIASGDLSRRVDATDPRTEVGRLGAALNTMMNRIESAFAERTASETRLRQFVADASHELQTPLTSVRGYAELFRRGAATHPADLANAMARIEAESSRMSDLVDDLLVLARLDQGRPMAHERVELAGLVGELVGDAHALEPERRLTLEAPDPVEVTGDANRLRQVVGNLLGNARRHTPRDADVTVRVAREGDMAVVEVADRGPGIPPEIAGRVFERFFRADPSRTRASGGSGLGLSIVAAIAEAHGGRAELLPTPGGGATFRVLLPVAPPLPTSTGAASPTT